MANDNLLLRERKEGTFGIEFIKFVSIITWDAATRVALTQILKLARAWLASPRAFSILE